MADHPIPSLKQIFTIAEETFKSCYDLGRTEIDETGKVMFLILNDTLTAILLYEIPSDGRKPNLQVDFHAGCLPTIAAQVTQNLERKIPVPVIVSNVYVPLATKVGDQIKLIYGTKALEKYYDSIKQEAINEHLTEVRMRRDSSNKTIH